MNPNVRNHRAFYYVLLALSTIFWGISFIFTKSLLTIITPVSIIFFRLLIASSLLLVITSLFYSPDLRKIPRRDYLNLLLLSCFEPFFYFLFETYSLKFADATVVSVIIATIPVFTLFLSVGYFKEKLSKINIAGVFVSVLGIAIMLAPEFSTGTFTGLGILLAVLAVLSSVGYAFFLRKVSDNYHPVFIVTCQNTVGTLLFLPLFLLMHRGNEMLSQWRVFTQPATLRDLLILAVCCSAAAFIFYVKGMQKVGLGRSQTFTNLIPVATAVFSFFVLNEAFTFCKILGMLIVVAGVCCVQYNPKQLADGE